MRLGEKQEIFMSSLAKLIVFAESKGFRCRGRELERTMEQQEKYLRSGKSKTMNSNHLNSCAIDMYFSKDGKLVENKKDLQEIGDYWESLHERNRWGGNFKSFVDCPHFEFNSYD